MNNFVKKNIVNSLSSYSDLPYQSVSNVGLHGNQLISESLNDSFYKLIDNDLFVEHQLNDIQNYKTGPKDYNEKNLQYAVDGYKMWSKDISSNSIDPISILHKYELPISATLSSTDLINKSINFIVNVGELLVGTNNGIYRQTTTDSLYSWTKTCVDIDNNSNNNINCKSYYLDNDYFIIISDTGLYSLNNFEDIKNGYSSTIEFSKILDKNNINNIDINNSTIWIAADDGLFKGTFFGSSATLGNSYTLSDYTPITHFDDVIYTDYGIYSIGNSTPSNNGKNSIYKTYDIYSFSKITPIEFPQNTTINKIAYFENKPYFLSNKGLYLEDKTLAIDSNTSEVINYCIFNNDFYIIFKNKELWKKTHDSEFTKVKTFSNELVDIKSTSSILFIAEKKKINYYSLQYSMWEEIDVDRTVDIISLVLNNDKMYIFDSSKKVQYIDSTQVSTKESTAKDIVFQEKTLNKSVSLNTYNFYLTTNGLYTEDKILWTDSQSYNFIDLINCKNLLFAVINNSSKYQLAVSIFSSTTPFTICSSIESKYICSYNNYLYIYANKNIYYIDINNTEKLTDFNDISKYTLVESNIDISGLEVFNSTIYFLETNTSNLKKYEPTNFVTYSNINFPSEFKSKDENNNTTIINRILIFKNIENTQLTSICEYLQNSYSLESDEKQTQSHVLAISNNNTLYINIKEYFNQKLIPIKSDSSGNNKTIDTNIYSYIRYQYNDESNTIIPDDKIIFNSTDKTATIDGDSEDNPYVVKKTFLANILVYVDSNYKIHIQEVNYSDNEAEEQSKIYDNTEDEYTLTKGNIDLNPISIVSFVILNNTLVAENEINNPSNFGIAAYTSDGNIIHIKAVSTENKDLNEDAVEPITTQRKYNGETYDLTYHETDYIYDFKSYKISNIKSIISGNIIKAVKVKNDDLNRILILTDKNLFLYNKDGTTLNPFLASNHTSSNYTKISFNSISIALNSELECILNGSELIVYLKTNGIIYSGTISDIESSTNIVFTAYFSNDDYSLFYFNNNIYVYGSTQKCLNLIQFNSTYNNSSEYQSNIDKVKSVNNNIIVWDKSNNIYKIPSTTKISQLNNIENITYLNSSYYFCGKDTGLTSSNSLTIDSSSISYQTVNRKKVYDVVIDVDDEIEYKLEDGIFKDEIITKTRQILNSTKLCSSPISLTYNYVEGNTTYAKENNTSLLSTFEIYHFPANIAFSEITELPEQINNDRIKVDDNSNIYIDGKIVDSSFEILEENNYFAKIKFKSDNSIKYVQLGQVKTNEYIRPFLENIYARKMYDFNDENIVFTNKNGINIIYPSKNSSSIRLLNQTNNFKLFENDNYEKLILSGNTLGKINDLYSKNSFEPILTCTNINTVYNNSKYDYLIGTSSSLKYTSYQYETKDDLTLCSMTDIEDLLKSKYEDKLLDHLLKDHSSLAPIYKLNNNLMPVDCSDLYGISKNSNIDNIIESVEFSDYMKYIRAHVSFENELSIYNDNDLSVTYIFKKYLKSRQGELYIYLPTTNTYYINHVDEITSCTMLEDVFERTNVNQILSRSIEDNTTYLSVLINKEHFKIDNIYFQQINGNSLPLKIYKDTSGKCGNSRFSTIVKQSLVQSLNYTEENGDIILKFLCFGQDSQAIHLLFNFYITYTISYDGNGADEGEMESHICKSSEKTKLNTCAYVRHGYIFKGWSTNKYTSEVQYKNCDSVVNLTDEEGKNIILYAVWELYQFNNGATVLKIRTDSQPINLNHGERLESEPKVFVDYDYSVDTTLKLKSDKTQFNIAHGEAENNNTEIVVDFDYND